MNATLSGPAHFAYVFQRFPSFTQTFCAREVLELQRQGVRLMLFSMRDTREADDLRHFPKELVDSVHFLPQGRDLVEEVKRLKSEDRLPQEVVLTLRHWGDRPDKQRIYEAAYIGLKLTEAGVTHAHSHFAGIGARTCWWMRVFYPKITYSFTGHANDIWCQETELDVPLEKLVTDAACVVSVSDFSVNDLRKQFPQSAYKIHRVYNGLDIAPFDDLGNQRDWESSDPPLVFSVGRLIEKKGYDELIDACALLKKESVSFRCSIAGDGPLEDNLQSRIAEHGLENDVRLLGAKSQEEIIELLRETRLFVLPCVTGSDGGRDNLPTVIMEAMAASLPCVSTRLAGVPEMIEDGVTGHLVNERDTDGLAKAMAGLLADPEKSRKFGELGQRRANALFAKEVTARHLRELLTASGKVKFDKCAFRDPPLLMKYGRQWARRFTALFRRKPVNVVTFPKA